MAVAIEWKLEQLFAGAGPGTGGGSSKLLWGKRLGYIFPARVHGGCTGDARAPPGAITVDGPDANLRRAAKDGPASTASTSSKIRARTFGALAQGMTDHRFDGPQSAEVHDLVKIPCGLYCENGYAGRLGGPTTVILAHNQRRGYWHGPSAGQAKMDHGPYTKKFESCGHSSRLSATVSICFLFVAAWRKPGISGFFFQAADDSHRVPDTMKARR